MSDRRGIRAAAPALGEAKPLPGFAPARLDRLMRAAIARSGLDLSGLSVLTEAATGAYAVTPVIAALAGARHVTALARASRYGTVAEVRQGIEILAGAAEVGGRIEIVEALRDEHVDDADIVTNSGHLRPLGRPLIERVPEGAVVALMFEGWEYRDGDLDLAACRSRGIPVVAVHERHPSIDVFSFLAPLCGRLLHDAGIAVYRSRLALLCDNPFGPSMLEGLRGQGAEVEILADANDLTAGDWDAVVVALTPRREPRIDRRHAAHIARMAPTAALIQFWGDVDRASLAARGIAIWPPNEPRPGHMAALLSEIGPEAVIRLQAGGLRAAEIVHRGKLAALPGIAEVI